MEESKRTRAAKAVIAVLVWSRRGILLVGLLFGLLAAVDPEGADRTQYLTIMLLTFCIYVLGGFQIRAYRRAMRRRT